jgi:hypothetical protein
MRILWLVGVCLLVSGCGNFQSGHAPWPASLQSIVQFSSTTEGELKDAIADLNGRLMSPLMSTTEDSANYQVTIQLTDPWPDAPLRVGFATVGTDHCLVQLSRKIFEDGMQDYIKPVVWHEIGHCTGLVHVPQQGEVMYMSSVGLQNYTQEALDRFFNSIRQASGIR